MDQNHLRKVDKGILLVVKKEGSVRMQVLVDQVEKDFSETDVRQGVWRLLNQKKLEIADNGNLVPAGDHG